MLDIIAKRRSLRKFLPQKVEQEKIIEILKAGMQAPSAMNQQSWEFIVIDDQAKLTELSKIQYANPLASANFAIVVLLKTQVIMPEFSPEEMGACVENMLLEAVNQGLGGVWLGVRKELDDDRQQIYRRVLQIDDTNYVVGCCLAFGYPDQGENKFIDRFDTTKIHANILANAYEVSK